MTHRDSYRNDLRAAAEVAWDVCKAGLSNYDDLPNAHADLVKAAFVHGYIVARTHAEHSGPNWRPGTDKPPHLPGEHHSQDVLLLMKKHGWIDEERIKIGHVSLGHWRPRGGNGNFDDDVEGWMPLPDVPSATNGSQK